MEQAQTTPDKISLETASNRSGAASDTRGHTLLPILALTILFLVLVARAAADPTLWVSASVTLNQTHAVGAELKVN